MTEDYYPYILKFFKKWARIYDVIIFLLAGVRPKAVETAAALPGARVLDVATGTGKQAYAFARAGYQVTGIDLSEDMLRIAVKNNKYKNLSFEIGDAARLPYVDNRFDVSSVSFALHDMPAAIREKVIAEMVRVTRPGGAVVIVDYALPRNRLFKKLAYLVIKSYESRYYPEFAKNGISGMLEKSGLSINAERGVMFGMGRIVRGVKAG
jgi:ubiquinone/menaquinone biosynthesis C-methylase UbiE